MKRDEPSNLATFCAVLAWIGITAGMAINLFSRPYNEVDLFFASLLGVSNLAPSWIVLMVATALFPRKKSDDT